MEKTLGHQAWLAGDTFSLADVATTPYIDRLDMLGMLQMREKADVSCIPKVRFHSKHSCARTKMTFPRTSFLWNIPIALVTEIFRTPTGLIDCLVYGRNRPTGGGR
jgi:hypothetical protein